MDEMVKARPALEHENQRKAEADAVNAIALQEDDYGADGQGRIPAAMPTPRRPRVSCSWSWPWSWPCSP